MEPILERLEALERQNRFWRGMVGLMVLGSLVLLPLRVVSGPAVPPLTMAEIAELRALL